VQHPLSCDSSMIELITKCCIRALVHVLVVIASSSACVPSPRAEEVNPMTFNGYTPTHPSCQGNCAWAIFGDGVIEEGTAGLLQNFLSDHNIPYNSTLYLNSPGGSLSEGLKLGRLIRKVQLFTHVGRSGEKRYDIRAGECYSACALAFLGGPYRFHETGSEYGVHRFYGSPGAAAVSSDQAQIVSAAIIEYIRAMGVHPSLFTFMTEAGADEIKLLSEAEQLRLNVVNNGEGPAVWTLESLKGILYLKGSRPTWRGMNKFLIICNPRSGPFLQIHYNAENRGKEILSFRAHHLVIDGEYPDPQIFSVASLLDGKVALNSPDVISASYKLTSELLQKISRARSVGIAMKPSENSQIFMGFYGMKFADGADKLAGLMNACPFSATAPSTQYDPFAERVPRRASDPFR
jgi:hypothetical protein